MSAVADLERHGQHVWLDDMSRSLIDEGTLGDLVQRCDVSGVTANPTIFERAIADGEYDDWIAEADGTDENVFWELAIHDVARAADLLEPAHRTSEGETGHVSLELSPRLADDVDGSVRQGVELRDRVARPNLMVKVPGTRAGSEVIEELTYHGVDVNVTLLFGLSQWQAARNAYERGLRRRLDDGLPLEGVRSVASFFLSRIDDRLDGDLPDGLRHRAAVASAATVLHEWRVGLERDEWRRLAGAGAAPQQLLWASTAPKADELEELHYVERLVAPSTVTTLKRETLDALCSRSSIDVQRLDARPEIESVETISEIERATRPMVEVAEDLQVDGVEKFVDSFDSLLSTIAEVRERTRA